MTEKRYTPSGRWIKDNYIDKLLNIDFNTITDRNLCCDLLNQLNDENEQLKSALKELKEIGDYQTNHIKELQEEIRPIQDICKKYKIPLEDLPDVLEEYITLDNEEYEEKLKERTI